MSPSERETSWKSGQPITDWQPYYEFAREWLSHPGLDWAIIPDVIDGSELDNDMQIAKWINWKGWQEFCSRGHLCARSVPVWHLHESLERLQKLARAWDRIAFGSSGEFAEVGTDRWNERMHEAWAAICTEGRPRCRVHGLRMMNAAVFHRFPFSSVDSTNVAQNGKREAVRHRVSDALAREIIASRIESHNSARLYVPADKQATLEFA